MKIVPKLSLVFFFLLICQFQLAATSHTHFTYNSIDTIPQIELEYKGNRIIVKSIKVVKKKGKSYKIEYKLVNNGRNKIKLGKPSLIPKDLIIQFDKSLEENNLVDAKSSIIESIKKKSISLRPGQLVLGNKLKFTHQPIPPSDRMATVSEKSEEKIASNEKQQIPVKELDESVKDSVKDIVQEESLDNNELENPRFPTKSSDKEEATNTQKILLDETVLVQTKDKENSEKVVIKETESILEVDPNKDQKRKVDPIETEKVDSVASVQIIDEILNEEVSTEKLCADLMIEHVEILKKNKRFVLVKYTIKNVGNIPIALHGKTKKENDNIAIQSHFTRSHNLTRGSIPVDLSFVKKRGKDKKGLLAPQESTAQKLKIEISKITRFTPVLALTINPISTNVECNRLNNIYFIDLEEKAPETIKSPPQQSLEVGNPEKVTTLEN